MITTKYVVFIFWSMFNIHDVSGLIYIRLILMFIRLFQLQKNEDKEIISVF